MKANVKDYQVISKTGMDMVDGCLIVPVISQHTPKALDRLGKEIVDQVRTVRTRGVIINVSTVTIMDSHDFLILQKIAGAVSMMGTLTVIVGVRPGVASSLVDLDIEFGNMRFAPTTEDAFELLKARSIRNGSSR